MKSTNSYMSAFAQSGNLKNCAESFKNINMSIDLAINDVDLISRPQNNKESHNTL